MWRIYLGNTVGDNSTSGVRLAILSDSSADADKRKFFYPPDVALIYDSSFSSTPEYDLVTLVSGDRSNPTEDDVHNRAYAIRDYTVSGALASTFTPYSHSDLYDATLNLIQEGSDAEIATATTDLQASKGWYFDLKELDGSWIGEKGLSRPLILSGRLFFTTFLPDASGTGVDLCATPIEGSGRLFAVDLLTAAAVYPNWDGVGDNANYTRADRTYDTSLPGIPSEPVPVFQPKGVTIIIGGGGGGTSFDPDVGMPTFINYWHQSQ